MKSAPAIGFDYRPSRLLALSTLVVCLLSLFAILVCGLPAWSKAVLAVVTSLYAASVLREFLRSGIRRVLWHEAGHWRIGDAAGQEYAAELRHASVLGSAITLSFRIMSIGNTSIVLLPDNCDADIRRRLRVRLARAQAHDDQTA